MKYPRKFELCVTAFTVVLGLGFCPGAEEAEPAPTDQDKYSGKKIESQNRGYEMIRDRFYNAPKLGEAAPDFELKDQVTGEKVSLSSLRAEKPVVLLFGSYGCDVMRDGMDPLLKAYEAFGDQYEFVMIYIREAHSPDNNTVEGREVIDDPESFSGRSMAAAACRIATKLPFRILIDTMDDRVATRWAGWPVRIFVVERDGTVVYSGKPGPWGFNPGGGFKPDGADALRPHVDRFSQESLETFLSAHKPQSR